MAKYHLTVLMEWGSTFRINIKQGIVDDTVCMSVKEKDTKCIAGMYTLPVKEEAFKNLP